MRGIALSHAEQLLRGHPEELVRCQHPMRMSQVCKNVIAILPLCATSKDAMSGASLVRTSKSCVPRDGGCSAGAPTCRTERQLMLNRLCQAISSRQGNADWTSSWNVVPRKREPRTCRLLAARPDHLRYETNDATRAGAA